MSVEVALVAIVTAVAAGLIGSFAAMRRMSLAADPLSHVALPGIGVALALHQAPMFGAVAALLVGAFLVWVLEDKAQVATESILGIVFSAALAIGSLTTSGEELIDALFGGGGAPSLAEVVFVLLAAVGIIAFVVAERNRLVMMIVSPDLARTAGVNVRRVDLAYLLLFALTIGIGLRYLGVLLMGALIIIPAVTAKRVARNVQQMLTLSVMLAVVATVVGYGRGIVGAVEHRASDRSGRRGDVSAEPAPAARFRGTTTDASCRAPATTAARCASVTPDKQSVPSWLALDGAVLTAARDDTSTCMDGHTQAPLA